MRINNFRLKHCIAFIICFVITSCSKESIQEDISKDKISQGLSVQNEYYFWADGKKVYPKIDHSKMIIYDEIAENAAVISSLKEAGLSLKSTNFNYQEIVSASITDLSKIDLTKFGLLDFLPYLKLAGANVIPNGEIILQLLPDQNIQSVLTLIKDDVKSYREKEHNTYVIETKRVSNIFMLSNKIYETNNLVAWCQPNFFADIIKLN